MKVKLIVTEEIYHDDYSQEIIRKGITDWEEITDLEYNFLKKNLYRLNVYKQLRLRNPYGNLHIILQDEVPVKIRIDSIKDLIKEEEELQEKARKQREKAKKEREAKKLLKNKKSEEELYEELKAKLGK